MSFKNQLNEKKDPIDDIQRLMCSVPGCNMRWSVNMGRPMCSRHQWGDKPVKRELSELLPKSAPVKHWLDEEF